MRPTSQSKLSLRGACRHCPKTDVELNPQSELCRDCWDKWATIRAPLDLNRRDWSKGGGVAMVVAASHDRVVLALDDPKRLSLAEEKKRRHRRTDETDQTDWPTGDYRKPIVYSDKRPLRPRLDRPWQRFEWQHPKWKRDKKRVVIKERETKVRIVPYGRRRADPQRRVRLRCLTCQRLRTSLPKPIRWDGVCRGCDQSWRDAGRPWDADYDKWLLDRRREVRNELDSSSRPQPGKTNGADIDWILASLARPSLLPIPELRAVTRGQANMMFDPWENIGVGRRAKRRPSTRQRKS